MKAAAVHEVLAKSNFERDVAPITDSVAARLNWVVNEKNYPLLDVTVVHKTPVRFRMTAPDWDEYPPSVELLDPDGNFYSNVIPGGVFNPGGHPKTGRPFICMRGVLEYHTHESHIQDKWENYKDQSGMGLTGIMMQLAEAWRKAYP